MFRPSADPLRFELGPRAHRLTVSRPGLSLAVLLIALFAPLALAATTAAEVQATPAERAAVLKHFEILDLSDRVVLRPLATEARLPQIEIPDEGEEAIVSGRALDADEVSSRYGAAGGEVVATLLRLEPEARRAALGLPPRLDEDAEETSAPASPAPPAAPAPPDVPAPPHASDARVAFGHGVTVDAGERADEVVAIAGSIEVRGEVMGNAVAIGGSNRVSGKVYGDVVAIGGSVHLADTAEVFGEAVAVGGTVHRAPGAKVLGKVTDVAMGDAILRGAKEKASSHHDRDSWWDELSDLMTRLVSIALLALLCCLVLLVAPRVAGEAGERVRAETWSAGLIGLLAELLFVPLLVLLVLVLVISIIGIPLLLLVPFLLVAVVVAALVGFTGVAGSVGRWAAARFGRSFGSGYAEVVVGILAIQSLSILGDLLDLGGGIFGLFGTIVSILGFAVRFVAWTVGFGAVLMGVFAWRRRHPTAPPPQMAASAFPPAPASSAPGASSPFAAMTSGPAEPVAADEVAADSPGEGDDEPPTAPGGPPPA